MPPETMTLAYVAFTTLLVLAAGLLVLVRGRSRPIDAPRAGLAFATGAMTAFMLVLVTAIGLGRFFLAVNVAYCATAIAMPLAGLALLLVLARGRSATRWALAIALASLVPAPIAWHSTFVAPWQLETVRTEVPIAPERALARPITVAVLADLQTVRVTEHEREAVRRAMAARPDLILVPGDLVQVGTHRLPEIEDDFRALLAPLAAPLGVWFVQGNCETKEDARRLLAGTPVRFLDNEVVECEHDGVLVRICGVDLAFDSPRAKAALRAIEETPGDELRIVVAHRPDVVFALAPDTRVDLVVAGHTHGGQVRLPLVGPPIVLSRVPRAVGAGGLHALDGRRVYVSRGIGWEHGNAPRVRFLCPPEVSVLTLRPGSAPAGAGASRPRSTR